MKRSCRRDQKNEEAKKKWELDSKQGSRSRSIEDKHTEYQTNNLNSFK